MRDLTDLPAELLDEVLSLAFGVAPRYRNGYNDEGPLDIKSLSRLLLINRKHHLAFLPLVYAHWTYNGARHSYSGLWKFLRTAIRNPDLASTVQVLNIGNWGVFPPVYLDRNHDLQDQDERLQFTLDDEETVRIAIRRADIPRDLASQIFYAIFTGRNEYHSRDRRPLMALLLISLPCVSKINAHIPASDPFLGAILQTATGRQQSCLDSQPMWLPSLKELYVLGEVPGYFEESTKLSGDDIDHPSLKLNDIWPLFYFQSLRTLCLYGLDPDGFSQVLQQNVKSNDSRYKCLIEHLHVATQRKSISRAEDITALLTQPAALKSLSFSWDDDKAKTKEKVNGKRRNVWQISNIEVWNIILKYIETLEYLDIYHDFSPEGRTRRQTDYFGLLTQFARLRYVSIQAEMLIGGYVEDSVAPYRLRETLPPSIETLVFAAEVAGETVPDLPLQLDEVVSQFPHLTTVELTDFCVVGRSFRRGPTPAKYESLKRVCSRNGVQFGIQGICLPTHQLQHCPFPLGMRCLSQWKETYNLRIDARSRHAIMEKRAGRKTAGLRQTPSPQPPEAWVWTNKTHVLSFQDHNGNSSFMVFESEENTLLPPLVNFNIYCTHPEGALSQAEDLEDELRAMHAQIATDGFEDDDHYRLDVYFLPNASNEDCIAHYQAEKATRGNSMEMLLEAENKLDTDFPPPSTPRLPGMLETYDDSELSGVLFVYPDRSWKSGMQIMCFISYGADFVLGQTFDERWYGFDSDAGMTLGLLISELARAERPEPLAIYQNVTERGWKTW